MISGAGWQRKDLRRVAEVRERRLRRTGLLDGFDDPIKARWLNRGGNCVLTSVLPGIGLRRRAPGLV